jgi:hypothetical protein
VATPTTSQAAPCPLSDTLAGGNGNDTLKGDLGADTLDGAGGVDTADYSDKGSAVVVTLAGGSDATVRVGGVAEDTIRNIENVTGGSASVRWTGDDLARPACRSRAHPSERRCR